MARSLSNGPTETRLMQQAHLIIQNGRLNLVVESRAGFGDFGLSLIELGLAQLDDRTQAEFVASLCQIERLPGLREKLLGDGKALERRIGVEPRGADVTRNLVLEIADILLLRIRPRIGLRSQSIEEAAVENWNVHVKCPGRVARKQSVVAIWNQAGGA